MHVNAFRHAFRQVRDSLELGERGERDVQIDEDIGYHTERAMTELDQALRAGTVEVARAHARLSSLHLDRARDLAQARPELRAT